MNKRSTGKTNRFNEEMSASECYQYCGLQKSRAEYLFDQAQAEGLTDIEGSAQRSIRFWDEQMQEYAKDAIIESHARMNDAKKAWMRGSEDAY